MTTTAEPITEPVGDSLPVEPVVEAVPADDSDLLVEDVSIDGMCGVY